MLPRTAVTSDVQAISSLAAARQKRETRDWTVLFYLCGDHGQWSRRIRKNLQDIENILPSKRMYIAVQQDLANEHAKKFIIADAPVREADKIPVGEINTGDPETALEFFRWGIEQCPSKHVAIIMGGTGIAEPLSIVGNADAISDYEQLFAFCDDKSAEDALTPIELAEVFAALVEDRQGEPIDLVAFDMCSMQYLEIAYQLKTLVRVMIGSQNNERAPEWSYASLLNACTALFKPPAEVENPDAAQPPRGQSDLMDAPSVMGQADANDPRVLADVAVRVISDTYHKSSNRGLQPIVSALDLTHLDRVTRSLDTMFLALMSSLGNAVVWEARDRAFTKLLKKYQDRISGFKELKKRELIAYDLLELLVTLSAALKELTEQGGLAFWYARQLKKQAQSLVAADPWRQELGDRKQRDDADDEERQAFLDAQVDDSQFEKFIGSFAGDLKSQLDQAFEWFEQRQLAALQSSRRQVQDDPITQARVRALEAMWLDYHNLNVKQLEEDIASAEHLKTIADDVAKLLQPAPRSEATSGKWFVLASEPRQQAGEEPQRCGVLIHRPEHLDKLVGSKYLELDFHNRVHWVSLLGAVNLISSHPGAMWRLISSLLSTGSAVARDDLLRRLVGPDSVISGFGNQFRALKRSPCVTLSIKEETRETKGGIDPKGGSPQPPITSQGYSLVLESSQRSATVAEQFNRVNQQTVKSTLSCLEDLMKKRSRVTQEDLQMFEALGRTLGEDVIQKLNSQLAEEWQLVLEENPDDVLHMQLQLPLELMRYPWELMHDGEAFLGERYALGRQLFMPSGMSRRVPRRKEGGIKILIIGDPQLDAASGFQQLIAAREEAKEVADQFERLGQEMRGTLDFRRERDVYIQEPVTTQNFRDWLRKGEYDIIHFAGHAAYTEGDPERSSWIFSDGPMWAVEIRNVLAHCQSVPWLIFANACESGMGAGPVAGYQSNVFGLATACINSGITAFLGPLWPISDSIALQMAKDFYESLLLERSTVGEALRFAKVKAKQTTLNDAEPTGFFGTHTGLSWASLILYGDPTMKLMDTLGTSSLSKSNLPTPSEAMQQTKQGESRKLARRRRYSASGLRQRPTQSSVLETQELLQGPGMEPKILNSQQVTKEIPAGKYALELEVVNGVRYWKFFDGTGYRTLDGTFIETQLETNNSLREAIGLPAVSNAPPLAPRPIGHWLIDRDEGSVSSLVRKYDQGIVQSERFLRVHADRTTTQLGKAGLRWVNNATEGKLKRVLVILHDTLCDTKSVVDALGGQFIRWACRNYGAVVGFDHWTLSRSPAENADLLWDDLLKQLDERTKDKDRIDILAHGRGGLVARALIENQNNEERNPSKSVRQIVFAGTPNAGTGLVESPAWGHMADILVNMAHVDGNGMYGRLSGLYARLASLQHFSDSPEARRLDEQIPGLRAMRPDACRKHTPWPPGVNYSGIAAVYEPGSQNNVLGIIKACCNGKNRPEATFYDQPNDLMAETSSVWDSGNLTSTKNWRLLILNPNLPEATLQNLGEGDSPSSEEGPLSVGPRQAGVHRTNMLSLEQTQKFLMQRLRADD